MKKCFQPRQGIIRIEKIKNIFVNIGKIFTLRKQIGGRVLVTEVIHCLAEKAKQLFEIMIPPVLIDFLIEGKDWKQAALYILILSVFIPLFSFAEEKSRDLLSAYSCRDDYRILLNVKVKAMMVDYQDTLLAGNMQKESRAVESINEFLEADYLVLHEILGALFSMIMLGTVFYRLDVLAVYMVFAAAAVHYLLTKRKYKNEVYYTQLKSQNRPKTAYVEELLFHTKYGKDVRLYDASDLIIGKYAKVFSQNFEMDQKSRWNSFVLQLFDYLINGIQLLVVYLLAILKYRAGQLTIGAFTIYINAAKQIYAAIGEFLDALAALGKTALFYDDYVQYMDLKQTIVCDEKMRGKRQEKLFSGDDFVLQFDHVSFRYPGSSKYALQDICVEIKGKEIVSIVGENGAGKTTFIYLLLRLFDPTEGVIQLNGRDIRTFPYEEYRLLLAPVFQEYELFSASVRENVVLTRPYVKEQAEESYRFADIESRIRAMEQGDLTILTKVLYDEGVELSGGEQQKLALARAYYRKSQILILDEPTAALDPLSEHRIYYNVARRYHGTTVFISHRLTSTMFADQILVFDRGRIVQRGTHEELVQINGIYREMFEKQAYYYVREN